MIYSGGGARRATAFYRMPFHPYRAYVAIPRVQILSLSVKVTTTNQSAHGIVKKHLQLPIVTLAKETNFITS
jgi:hypothetical protein